MATPIFYSGSAIRANRMLVIEQSEYSEMHGNPDRVGDPYPHESFKRPVSVFGER